MTTFTVWRGVTSRKGEIVGKRKCRGCKEEMETESRAHIDRGFSACLIQGVVSLQTGLRTIAWIFQPSACTVYTQVNVSLIQLFKTTSSLFERCLFP